ncbi:hypothetical protein [Allomesorhizobium camelthorni]|uniref:hypothetical protein n=1 Tax=Allomesorhizobium camelthorni TaxID=475069 RepID=UPI00197F6C45|nr:hypothetical protein [Mesorhizobium camelthorni]
MMLQATLTAIGDRAQGGGSGPFGRQTVRNASFWRQGATSARASTIRASIRCS